MTIESQPNKSNRPRPASSKKTDIILADYNSELLKIWKENDERFESGAFLK